MAETDWGGNWVLFWWAGLRSVNLLTIFCWWVELCSLPAIYLGPNYGGGNDDNGDLPQKIPCMYCYTQCPQPCIRPPLTHASAGDSWTLQASLGQSLVGTLLLSPGSWCTQGSVMSLWKYKWNTTMRYHFTAPRIAIVIKRVGIDKDVKKLKYSYIANRNVKWCSYFGKQFFSS